MTVTQKNKPHYKRIVISDVHIGMRDCQIDDLYKFIKGCFFDELVLNGDIIDTFHLRNSDGKMKSYMKLFKLILKRMSKNNLKVVYIRGNHDNFIGNFVNVELPFDNFKTVEQYIIENGEDKILIVHGDIFDKHIPPIMYKLGSIGYDILLKINRIYNNYRTKRGKEYISISQKIKTRTKFISNFINKFEKRLVNTCKSNNCNIAIVGHIHHPIIKKIDGITYMNSGDWVESKTALVQKENGEWYLVDHLHQETYNQEGIKAV
jgi:UDP-2,3-diacylglucosamine pyrophosphatase LpxH